MIVLALVGCGSDPQLALRTGVVRPGDPGDGLAVVGFDRPLRSADRQALVDAGWTPIAPVGRGWIARGHGVAVPGSWVGALTAELKVDPALSQPGPAIGVAELAPGADVARLAGRLAAAGLPVDGVGRRIVSALGPDEVGPWVAVLADDPDVVWLTRRGRRELLDASAAGIGQSGMYGGGATPLFDAGLDGTGQIAAILDTGIDLDHCLFVDPAVPPAINTSGTVVASTARKVVAVDFLWSNDDPANPFAWDDQSHGTHVAGILAGDQGADGVLDFADGIALGAKLVIQDAGYAPDDCADLPALGCPVVDLVPLFEQAWAQGARVHSDSWGDQENAAVTNVYTDGSADADQASWDHPDLLLVFASGNNGGTNQVFSPSNAKDTLSVGATGAGADASSMAAFSSGGPTADGRIKPDVVFPGTAESALDDGDVTTGNCGTFSESGTSMAAPGAAGLAVLVRQYFADGWYPTVAPVAGDGFDATSALVKAVLIASAQEVNTSAAFQGWGRPQLDRVLPLAAGGARRLIALDEADSAPFVGGEPGVEIAFQVDSDAEPLVVTLVWRDPPGTPLSDPVLVNDLDLVVQSATEAWNGNVLADFWSAPGGDPDRANNVELVRLEHPAVGSYHATITPYQVAVGPQPYALVVSGAVHAGEPVPDGPTGDTGAVTVPPRPTGDTGASETRTPPAKGAGPGDDGGCGCAHGGGGGWLAGLVLLGLRRRATSPSPPHRGE